MYHEQKKNMWNQIIDLGELMGKKAPLIENTESKTLENKKDAIGIFEHPEFGKVRVKMIDGEPWFVGKDVATALGYIEADKALKAHVDDEDKRLLELVDIHIPDKSSGGDNQPLIGNPKVYVISESGLYSLILRSKLDTAKKFKRWITSEVLPSIRKTGSYTIPKEETPREFLARAVLVAQEALAERDRKYMELENKAFDMVPKVLFADAVAGSKDCISINELAKILCQNGINIGQNRLFTWLRDNKYLFYKGNDNIPTQHAMDLGLFEVRVKVIPQHPFTVRVPLVTGKGQIYFVNKFLKEKTGRSLVNQIKNIDNE